MKSILGVIKDPMLMTTSLVIVIAAIFILGLITGYGSQYKIDPMVNNIHKPAIYLYPEKSQYVNVELQFEGTLTKTIPEYGKGWRVKAGPDGRIQAADGQEYPYLFWEGNTDALKPNFKEGFLVQSGDTKTFLKNKLTILGLSQTEISDFIEYWEPKMKKNSYNLVYFAGKEYTDVAKLSIDPMPDSILRVFMIYKAVPEPIQIKEQKLPIFERKGFTVVEWGGAEINKTTHH